MTELCPMCKKHEIIIRSKKAFAKINGKPIEYDEEYCYCSTLGENDPDCYFIPPKLMDKNLKKAQSAYNAAYKRTENN